MTTRGADALRAAALVSLLAPVSAVAQNAPAQGGILTADQAMARGDALTRRRTLTQCRAEAAAARERGDEDIVVCGSGDDFALPVPEEFGPTYDDAAGAAVDPRREPCGRSISSECREGFGVNVLSAAAGAVNLVQLLLDPDRNLGEGTRIPERYRGANR